MLTLLPSKPRHLGLLFGFQSVVLLSEQWGSKLLCTAGAGVLHVRPLRAVCMQVWRGFSQMITATMTENVELRLENQRKFLTQILRQSKIRGGSKYRFFRVSVMLSRTQVLLIFLLYDPWHVSYNYHMQTKLYLAGKKETVSFL